MAPPQIIPFSPEYPSPPANREINVLCGAWTPRDLETLFGPIVEADLFLTVEPGQRWAPILKFAGVFPSVGEAKRNGWDKEISVGFDMFRVGKLKRLFASLYVKE